MEVNPVEILNVLIVSVLFFVIKHRRSAINLLWIAFIYGTLHFSFAVIPLFQDDHISLLHFLHLTGGSKLADYSALLLLACIFLLMVQHAYATVLLEQRRVNSVVIFILFRGFNSQVQRVG